MRRRCPAVRLSDSLSVRHSKFFLGLRTISDKRLQGSLWNLGNDLGHLNEELYCFGGQKVKGQGHAGRRKNFGFRTITDALLQRSSWYLREWLILTQGRSLLFWGSKGERSRSHGSTEWFRFPDDIWRTDAAIFMKPSEMIDLTSRKTRVVLGSKGPRSRSRGPLQLLHASHFLNDTICAWRQCGLSLPLQLQLVVLWSPTSWC